MAALIEMLPGLGADGLGLLLKAGLKSSMKLEVDGEAVSSQLNPGRGLTLGSNFPLLSRAIPLELHVTTGGS